jgi:two-component system, OmpR family, alkaline phosphatase synthesis response regulator PhoP
MSQPRILVADDEPHITHVVSLKLTNAGYDVRTAADGEEALELALGDPPDLLITDLQMPYMSGLELATSLKSDPRTADIPVLMLTARGFSIPRDEIERTNIAEVLSKPFSPKEVLAKVQSLLKGAGNNAEAA